MEEQIKTTGKNDADEELSFYSYFVPLTKTKAILWIIIIGLIVYCNILFNGFVLDDQSYIIFNPELHSLNLLTLFGKNVFNSLVTGQYDPIPATYFAVLFSLFNNLSFFYHFFQVALHIANSCLVFVLFKKFFSKKLAFVLSLVFLLHPIQEEAVAYISATGVELFFLFGITSLLLMFKTSLTPKKVALLLILLLFSLLSKETGVLFLVIVFIYTAIYKKRQLPTLAALESITLAFYLFMRFVVGGIYTAQLANIPIANLSLSERLTNIPAIVFYYIKTFTIPNALATNQLWIIPAIDFNSFYLPLIIDFTVLLFVIFLGFYLLKKNKKLFPAFLFFCSWLLIGFALHMQVVPLEFTVADRYFYFPIVGLLGVIGLGISSLKPNKSFLKSGYIFIVILLCVLSLRTIVRNANWINALTLLSHDSQIEDNFTIENDLGSQYGLVGDNKIALSHFQKSVAMYPYESNLYDVGLMHERLGNPNQAIEYYTKALNQKETYSLTHKHAMSLYFDYGKLLLDTNPTNAIAILKEGLADYPNEGHLWTLLALSEYRLHNQKEALTAAKKANQILHNEQTDYLYKRISQMGTIQMQSYNGTQYLINE